MTVILLGNYSIKFSTNFIILISKLSSRQNVFQQYHSSSTILPQYIKNVKLRTCTGTVYEYLRSLHPELYKNSTSDGVELTFDYVDTGKSDMKPDDKVIVALHGSADTYQTFSKMIEHFQSQPNVRVIVPNMPTFAQTRNTNFRFWNSNLERYNLMQDFFHYLKLTKIDCLIGHSFGVQPTITLMEKPGILQIKSVGLLAPQFFLEPFIERDVKAAKFLLKFRSKLGTKFLNAIKLYQWKGIPFKFNDIDQLFEMNTIVYDDDMLRESPDRVKLLIEKQVTGFMMYGTNERIIRPGNMAKTYKLMNVEDKDKILIDQDDPSVLPKLSANKILQFSMKDAFHFPHAKYPNVTNACVEQLLNIEQN